MKILLMCKEMIGYERTAIMVLGSKLKQSGHEVKAAVLSRPLTAEEKKKKKIKNLNQNSLYIPMHMYLMMQRKYGKILI